MVMAHTHAKRQGQRSLHSKVRVKTDGHTDGQTGGWTEAIVLLSVLMWSVKMTWREVVQKDCQGRNLNREDAMDCSTWRKLIRIGVSG